MLLILRVQLCAVLAMLLCCSCGVHDEATDTTTGSSQQFYTVRVEGPLLFEGSAPAATASAVQELMSNRNFSLGLGRVRTYRGARDDLYKLHDGSMTSWQWDIDPESGIHPYEWPRINDSSGAGSLNNGRYVFSQQFTVPYADMQNLHLEADFNADELQHLIFALRGMAKYMTGETQTTAQFTLSFTQAGQEQQLGFAAPCSVYFHELHNNW